MANTRDPRARRFREYVERLTAAVGHADRHAPMRAYLTGLCLPGERKSIEPMAARVDPRHVRARHQSMHHFVANAPWEAAAVLRVARDWVLAPMAHHGPVAAWIVDDTAFPKKGRHSVGVARQYCGVLGKQENCQVAVSVSVANEAVSVPVAYRLYLPESWARIAAGAAPPGCRRTSSSSPSGRSPWPRSGRCRRTACRASPWWPTPGTGTPPSFERLSPRRGSRTWWASKGTRRSGARASALAAEVGAGRSGPTVDPGAPNPAPSAGQPQDPRGRTAGSRLARGHLARGHAGAMRSRFARVRVRPAHRDQQRSEPRPEEGLLIEWPRGEPAPTKYWLATLPETIPRSELVRLAKLRWRIERDYQELKDEFGLDHFEGRGWRGFHHHGALCTAAYAFLAAERARFSPPAPLAFLRPARLPRVSRRGALPVRPERHVATSIATVYQQLARVLLRGRPCRSCGHEPRRR